MSETRPRYVAIITDGNGRWAAERGLPAVDGHQAGADTVKARLRDAAEFGIEELTVFSFSTENWQPPAGGGRRADGDVRRADRPRDPRARRGGRADALRRPPRGGRGRSGRAHGVGRADDRRRTSGSRCSSPSTTAAGRRSSTRRETSRAGAEDEFRGHALRARDARPRPPHPYQRRAADLELPALAVRLLGARRSATSCGPTSTARSSRRRWPSTTTRARRFGGR